MTLAVGVATGRSVATLRSSVFGRSYTFKACPKLRSLPQHRRSMTAHVAMSAHATATASCAPSAARGLDSLLEAPEGGAATPVELVPKGGLQAWLLGQPPAVAAWAAAMDFKGRDGDVLLVPAAQVKPGCWSPRLLCTTLAAFVQAQASTQRAGGSTTRRGYPRPPAQGLRGHACLPACTLCKNSSICFPFLQGGLERVVLAAEDPADLWTYAALKSKLPPGLYQLQPGVEPDAAALGWLLGKCCQVWGLHTAWLLVGTLPPQHAPPRGSQYFVDGFACCCEPSCQSTVRRAEVEG
jgi:hypothetical protein